MKYGTKCPNCGKEYCVIETAYNVDGEFRCRECLNLDKETRPYYIQHIPSFVDGATAKVFIFATPEELFDKLNRELDEGEIYVYDDNALMTQSTVKSFWWVLGFIHNFDIKTLNIPHVNYDIYNSDETVNQEELRKWLGDL